MSQISPGTAPADIGKGKINLGIIGVGHWGANVLKSFQAIDGVNVSWVCDRNLDRLQGAIQANSEVTDDYRKVLADSHTDSVAIATGIPTHYGLVKASLEAGKHVFVEKPLSTDLDEVEELVNLAAGKNLTLFVDYLLLYVPLLNDVNTILQEQTLGELQTVQLDRLHTPRDGDFDDVITDLLPHDYSIMHCLFEGVPSEVSATIQAGPGGKGVGAATLLFRYPSGLEVGLNLSRVHFERQRTCQITGTNGTMIWDDIVGTITLSPNQPHPHDSPPPANDVPPLLLACQDFFGRVNDGSSPDHEISLMLAKTYKAIRESESEKRWVSIR